MISSTRSRLLLLAAAAWLAGCAGAAPQLPPTAVPVELTSVPFFPQTDYQCGPAALATVLSAAGLAVDADDLVRQVYVAGLRGSLQPELLGATRRHGLIPYVLEPRPEALFRELAAGRPVLVLQNLGLPRAPVWHYAVVVGVDGADVILRSGTEQRHVESARRFLRSWQRGQHWAFVAIRPGDMPATATATSYVRAVAGAEPLLAPTAAAAAYDAALGRWPDDELALFAAAGQKLAARDWDGAIVLYRRLLDRAPSHAAARNNLANALAQRGCPAEGLREARTALATLAADDAFRAAVLGTVAELEQAAAAGAASACG